MHLRWNLRRRFAALRQRRFSQRCLGSRARPEHSPAAVARRKFFFGLQLERRHRPKDSRPRRWDTAWQAEESNRFGTDEFIQYCRKLGSEPYITVNMGTGTMQDAADWVEYCNGTMNTAWANLRRKNGHPEPYNVKYWGLGNEIYGSWQAGHKTATAYADLALEFAKMMQWVDPSVKLIACGGNNADWDREVLERLVDVAG